MYQLIGNITLFTALFVQFAIVLFKLRFSEQFHIMYHRMLQLYYVVVALITISFGTLITAFVTHQYQFDAVVQNSDNSMSTIELIVATWAGRAGVLLLWATLATYFTLFVLLKLQEERRKPVIDRSLSIMLVMNAIVLIFNFSGGETPFSLGDGILTDGFGISPSLESFWQQVHPPLAFIAYSAFIYPYALGLSALIGYKNGERLTELSRMISRNLMIIGWLCLNLLIIAGSIWAYEANWNGFWAWDPIEVSSLVMWMLVTAYFHISSLTKPDDPLRLVSLTSGWVGVSFASFVVRSGLWDGFHGYVGIEKAIVFGSIFLLSISGVAFAIVRSGQKIIPDHFYSFKGKTPHVITFWAFIGLVVVNVVGLLMQLYNNLVLQDSTIPYEYYMLFDGVLLFALVVLLVLCDVNAALPNRKTQMSILLVGVVMTGAVLSIHSWGFVLVMLLTSVVGGVFLLQLVAIGSSVKKGENFKRIKVQLVHLSIIMLLLPYFVVDFSTTRVNVEAAPEKQIHVDEFSLAFTVHKSFDNPDAPYPQYYIDVIMDTGELYQLEIHQGEYKGAYWNRGDWLVEPLRDIYFILLDFNGGYVVDPQAPVVLQISEKPYANLYRISMIFQTLMAIMLLAVMLRGTSHERFSATQASSVELLAIVE